MPITIQQTENLRGRGYLSCYPIDSMTASTPKCSFKNHLKIMFMLYNAIFVQSSKHFKRIQLKEWKKNCSFTFF